MPIRYITYHELDRTKWNNCIGNATNGLIYAYSFYLDTMAKQWEALVLDDYELVMPLTYNKKYGIHYLYQPPFTAQLGVFGNNITAEILSEFLKAIPSKFKYWDISFNHANYFQLDDLNLHERMNFVLPLDRSYEEMYAEFRENIQRNIKKCEQLGCMIQKDIALDEVIALSKEQASTFSTLSDTDFLNIKTVFILLQEQQSATTYGVYHKDQLMASAAFFFSNGRAYYILVGNHPNGKTIGASHALINAFIKDHAGKNIILDFEGSDIHSLAFFYSSFGAIQEKYPAIKINKLPWYTKWLKK